jgi:hypothetical protein
VKDVQTLPGADIDSDHNLLVAKICTRLKKIIRFQTRRPQWDLEKLYTQKQIVQDTLEGKLSVIECDSGNVEVQWNNIKKCVLDTLSDLVGKVEKKARKPWITQEMISKMDKRRRWKNVNTEEGRKNKKRTLFTSTLNLELRKKLVKCYIWSIALYGAKTRTFRAVDQKHLKSFEMWCWR